MYSVTIYRNWAELREVINKNMCKKTWKRKIGEVEPKKWWDKECKRKKRKVKTKLIK